MINLEELKRKFPAKKPIAVGAKPSKKAALKAIEREYELKKAELKGGAPLLRKGPLFYLFVLLLLAILGSMVLTASKNGIGFGKARLERKPVQAKKSMAALAVALGRYKFHTGEYPSTTEGLAALAAKKWNKKGWDGPYVNHIVNDPWGNEYYYETRPEGGTPILYSKGPNGRAGDEDDVLPELEAFDEPFRDTTWTNGWAPYRLRGVVVAPDEETKKLIEAEMREYDR